MRKSVAKKGGASDTSFESMMDDSPSKYDQQNQRYSLSSAPDAVFHNYNRGRWAQDMPDNIKEESDTSEVEHGHKKKKRRKNAQGYIVEEITGRDI